LLREFFIIKAASLENSKILLEMILNYLCFAQNWSCQVEFSIFFHRPIANYFKILSLNTQRAEKFGKV